MFYKILCKTWIPDESNGMETTVLKQTHRSHGYNSLGYSSQPTWLKPVHLFIRSVITNVTVHYSYFFHSRLKAYLFQIFFRKYIYNKTIRRVQTLTATWNGNHSLKAVQIKQYKTTVSAQISYQSYRPTRNGVKFTFTTEYRTLKTVGLQITITNLVQSILIEPSKHLHNCCKWLLRIVKVQHVIKHF